MLGACAIVDLPVEGIDVSPFLYNKTFRLYSNSDDHVTIVIYFLYTVFYYH